MRHTVTISIGNQKVDLRFDRDEVYKREDRERWIENFGATGFRALFDQSGLSERMSDMVRRLIKDDDGRSSADEVELMERRASELAAKGM